VKPTPVEEPTLVEELPPVEEPTPFEEPTPVEIKEEAPAMADEIQNPAEGTWGVPTASRESKKKKKFSSGTGAWY
jgi:hypothetical protein